ncbi:Zinc finger CCCH domain-containing protein [Actinidia chinensis var. chinensis]|uniref:Zinc finger CCCH domain-containing protein n=1 Tax=Actinidia chinensis var. chinensis TaxID=1590841 RepID=A0A2R6RL66_ACTCC|nr:Zinc finger CCCH domain-containing protein [Actinidia chinensis var. chinensis]
MVETRGMKRPYASISDEEEELEEGSESRSDSETDTEALETSDSSSCDDDGDDEGDESDDDQEDEESSDFDEDESIRKREKNDLQELTLYECKSYLRKHGLRLSGTKAECVRRIREHRRMKDENAEALYPRSSFAINCTGDVCKGDTVLFRRKVYKKSDKGTRRGSFLGTITGRVVKESYGATKQQHTFTIEVLWSKGIKKLPPLVPILVKGRKLYKFKTFRQEWKDETKRLKVLAEKHKRGAEARLVRAMRTTKHACLKNIGVKRQKYSHPPKPSQTGKKAEPKKARHGDGCGKSPMNHIKPNNRCQDAPPAAITNLKMSSNTIPQSSNKHQNLAHPNKIGDQAIHTHNFPSHNLHQSQMHFTHPNNNGPPTTLAYNFPPQNLHQSPMQLHHQWNATFPFPSHIAGSAPSAVGIPHFMPNANSSVMPLLQCQVVNPGPYSHSAYSHPSLVIEPRNLNSSPQLMNIYALSNLFSLGK